jgi:hypothetical protein
MGYELVGTPRAHKVTKSMAEKWAGMEQVRNDRPLSTLRVAAYKKLAAAGLMRPVHWAKAHCLETQENYRVNGKHTSTAFSQMEEVPETLQAYVEEYQCETLRDVAELYATFDARITLRTTSDINKSFAAVDPDLCDLQVKVINIGISGISLFKWGLSYERVPAAERAECLFDPECKAFFNWLSDLVNDSKKNKRLRRAPVVWAMYASFRKSRKAATEFWTAVRDETGSSPSLPDRRLSRWLIENAADKLGRRAGTNEMYAKCVIAWNAWRDNSPTNLAYHAEKKLPSVK